ncbi:glycine cleavage system protein GcvH [Candidatus Legionella polyplacis]|uniref:Glycine cleavage system protein GcvH n=1 Tax=Candidatus Legionella polyplacis TaxID=2005262 RepID=A0ABZ2GVC3_9GAMM
MKKNYQLRFTDTHEWIETNNSKEIYKIGITNYAQKTLGDLIFINFSIKKYQTIKTKDIIAIIESIKAASDIYSPINGTVIEINKNVEHDPSIINHDPYDAGWLVKIKPTNINDIKNLLDQNQYEKLLNS